MAIITLQMDMDGPSTAPSYYIFGALENTSILCLVGSRMFINLMEAGHPDVKNGSGTGDHSGRGNIISDIQFGDPSGPRSGGKYILQDARYNSLTSTS